MDLADRLVAIDEWSTAKKTAVIALAFGAPVQVLQFTLGRLAISDSGAFDLRWIDTLVVLFIAHMVLIGGLSSVVAARGNEGRWTAHALYVPYAILVGVFMYALGPALAPAWLPLVMPAILAMIWYQDLRIGIVAAVSSCAVAFSVAVLTATGAVPYAPAIRERSFDVFATLPVLLAGAALLTPILIANFVLILAVTVVLRRERERLAAARDQLDKAFGLVSRYVPKEVASEILAGPDSAAEGYRRQKVTSFFSDIVAFTELAEEMEPEDLAQMLNEYFSEMAAIAERHHGTVDELQGDGLILVFGAPTFRSDREHALDAVRAASEMQAAISTLNDRWRRDGLDVAIQVRMGINTGVVTVGHFGSGNRLKYTVLGKHVNLAARIQAMCEPGKVLISHATWLLVKEDVSATSLGVHDFKGITRPIEVHELVSGDVVPS